MRIDVPLNMPYRLSAQPSGSTQRIEESQNQPVQSNQTAQKEEPPANQPTKLDGLRNISTQGFLELKTSAASGEFAVDDTIQKLSEQLEEMASFVDTFRKLTELVDPKRIEQLVIQKTLETMNEVAEGNK
jgi:hypothetical protein